MSHPRRWIEEENGSVLREERELLRAGLTLDPPDGAQDKVWASMLAQLGPVPMTGGSGSGISGSGIAASGSSKGVSAAASAGIIKSMLIGAAAGCVVLGAYAVVVPAEPPKRATAKLAALERAPELKTPQVEGQAPPWPPPNEPLVRAPGEPLSIASKPRVLAGTPEPLRVPVAIESLPVREEAIAPLVTQLAPASRGSDAMNLPGSVGIERESRLGEERQLISDARSTLRRGDISGALALLEQGRVRFPGGVLGQEREALTIEALWASGQRTAASQRAAAFLRAYPMSPHASRIQAFVQ